MLSKERLMSINKQLFYERCHYPEVQRFLYIFEKLDPNNDIDFALLMLDTTTDPVLRKAINVVIDEITY